ncbi:hypothetical protein G6F56_007737 [Rhizopus delemar]|nr:hypothetical protein G6F56_007737 [Rhizopus delemar]
MMAPLYDHKPESTCLLGPTLCGYFDYDTWTLSLTIWVLFQLTWSVFLLGVQLYQIAVGMTTNESANMKRYSYMNTYTAALPVDDATSGKDSSLLSEETRRQQQHNHGSGFCPCLQLVAGARAVHKARKQTKIGNVFDHGCWNNCLGFWIEPNTIDYHQLYDVQQLNKRTADMQV